jgi:hypothetical protein
MLAVCGDTVIDESVFVPPDVLLETPPHPIAANVMARVEAVKTEESKKRQVAFINSLYVLGTDLWVGRSLRSGFNEIGCSNSSGIGTFDCAAHIFFFG